MLPDVSVIIPTYNRRSMGQQVIKSCFERNDGIDERVVVVGDSSTDGTRDERHARRPVLTGRRACAPSLAGVPEAVRSARRRDERGALIATGNGHHAFTRRIQRLFLT
jgi:GT2 family glycosyltransferase